MESNTRSKENGRARRWTRFIAVGLSLSLVLAGCVSTPSMLRPAAENSSQVADLTWTILALAAFVFIVVEALLLYSSFRYRRREGMGLPRQVSGNVPLEIGWTAFPAVILAVVFALTLGTLNSLDRPPAVPAGTPNPSQALHIKVIGHQWWWEFQYPDLKITTANELHVPVGSTLLLDVTSGDVIHSFWVPQMGGKIDALPDHVNHIWYRVTQPGTMNGQCAEFCGAEHALMRMQVVAQTPDQFAAWVKDQQTVPAPAQGAMAVNASSFIGMPCVACHTIQGTKAFGQIGPDLTHFGSRATFAGGSFENTPENVQKWIENPQAMKPGTLMPNLNVPPSVAQQITIYLESLK